jgi:hypothetical protein
VRVASVRATRLMDMSDPVAPLEGSEKQAA